MHPEAIDFCQSVKRQFPQMFHGKVVLDVGSYDVNGNNRHLFHNCTYTGVDVAEGMNVDIVGQIHELPWAEDMFDVVVSTEMLEHDPNYKESLRTMYRILKPGGLLILTCATTGRKEHGTSQSEPEANPGFRKLGDYYRNLTRADVVNAFDKLKAPWFSASQFVENHVAHDLYFWGIKL